MIGKVCVQWRVTFYFTGLRTFLELAGERSRRGYLGGYAWTLMAISFAQRCQPPLVPSLQAKQRPVVLLVGYLVRASLTGNGRAKDLGGDRWSAIQHSMEGGWFSTPQS